MAKITPNMGLTLPDNNQDQGDINQSLINALDVVDTHDHAPTKGTKVKSAGIDVDDTLVANNNAISKVKYMSLSDQENEDDIPNLSVYSKGGNFYFKDSKGAKIQITNDSSVSNILVNIDEGSPTFLYYGWVGGIGKDQISAQTDETIKNLANAVSIADGTRRMTNSLYIGGFLNLTVPDALVVGAYYYPWIAFKTAEVTNLEIYSIDQERETGLWIDVKDENAGPQNDPGSRSYRMKVRTSPFLVAANNQIDGGIPQYIFKRFLSQAG